MTSDQNIRMELENLENFTYDGNDTNFEPLYSLKDNVSIVRNELCHHDVTVTGLQ